jgi:hypothetical protein
LAHCLNTRASIHLSFEKRCVGRFLSEGRSITHTTQNTKDKHKRQTQTHAFASIYLISPSVAPCKRALNADAALMRGMTTVATAGGKAPLTAAPLTAGGKAPQTAAATRAKSANSKKGVSARFIRDASALCLRVCVVYVCEERDRKRIKRGERE